MLYGEKYMENNMKQLFIRGVYAIFEYRLREIRLFGFL
jgi:hypothetical protein